MESQSTIIAAVTAGTFLILIVFITGFICGCLCQKYKHALKNQIERTIGQTNADQQFASKGSVSHNLEMIENVAYGQVRQQ